MGFQIPIEIDGSQPITASEIGEVHAELTRQIEANGAKTSAADTEGQT